MYQLPSAPHFNTVLIGVIKNIWPLKVSIFNYNINSLLLWDLTDAQVGYTIYIILSTVMCLVIYVFYL